MLWKIRIFCSFLQICCHHLQIVQFAINKVICLCYYSESNHQGAWQWPLQTAWGEGSWMSVTKGFSHLTQIQQSWIQEKNMEAQIPFNSEFIFCLVYSPSGVLCHFLIPSYGKLSRFPQSHWVLSQQWLSASSDQWTILKNKVTEGSTLFYFSHLPPV